jgi:hypothetical protein
LLDCGDGMKQERWGEYSPYGRLHT